MASRTINLNSIITGTVDCSNNVNVRGDVFVGNPTYATTGFSTDSGCRLEFDSTFNGTEGTGTPANKIRTHNVPSWVAGIGLEAGGQTYFSGANHNFYTGTSQSAYGNLRFQVASNGNVGVGVNAPSAKLEVVNTNTGYDYPTIQCKRNLGSNDASLMQHGMQFEVGKNTDFKRLAIGVLDNGVSVLQSKEANVGYNTLALNPVAGNVGIGTTAPQDNLHVAGGLRAGTSTFNINFGTSGTYGRLGYFWHNGTNLEISNQQNGHLMSFTNNTERMRITNDGNVGIGTSTPQSTLDINGTTIIRGGPWTDGATAIFAATPGAVHVLPKAYTSYLLGYFRPTNGQKYYYELNGVAYNFTGQHTNKPVDSILVDNLSDYVGLIVRSSGEYYAKRDTKDGPKEFTGVDAINVNESLPQVELTTTDKDKAVWGVISDYENGRYDEDGNPRKNLYDPEWGNSILNRLRVNGVGEGAIWITNINGNLENGDYICSSVIPGYGRKQDDDLLHNYTVAKITMNCDFQLENGGKYRCEEITHDGITYRRAFVGCTYHCS